MNPRLTSVNAGSSVSTSRFLADLAAVDGRNLVAGGSDYRERYPARMQVFVSQGDLPAFVAEQAASVGVVAVDTETTGLDPKQDRLGLVQVLVPGAGVYLLRRVAGTAPILSTILQDPGVEKVFHFAPFDLGFLYASLRIETRSVWCTKAASRLLGPRRRRDEHSLARLVAQYFGVTLDKGSVRTSDWDASHLSDQQVAYAVRDVEFLVELRARQARELEERALMQDFRRVCDYMPTAAKLAVEGFPDPLTY